MPYHVGLVLGDKLFEYENGDMYYKGYKKYNVKYNSVISWDDLECIEKPTNDIKGTTSMTADELDSAIKKDSSWATKGHYDLLSHNCQHFTHFCDNILKKH